MINIFLASPRGFCAGVTRAIEIVEKALIKYGAPIYVRHEIVHNKYVVENLRAKGAVFVDNIADIPLNAIVIFSAHGVSKKTEEDSKFRNLEIIDATCPLVTKVHIEAQKNEQAKKEIILIGHKGHPEVEGTSGRVASKVILVSKKEDVDLITVKDPNNLCYITQTTLSMDDTKDILISLKKRFPNISGPDLNNICYATQNRQNAVKQLAAHVEVIIVIGSDNSSNSNRLRDLAEEMGKKAYIIDNEQYFDFKWIENITNIGITAGASAPEILVERLIEHISKHYQINIQNITTTEENIIFKLPKKLS